MSKRAYVGNIPFSTTADDIRRWFAPYTVGEVTLVTDRETGQPRGFAFVEFNSSKDMDDAIASHNGRDLGGRRVLLNEATEKIRTAPATGTNKANRGRR